LKKLKLDLTLPAFEGLHTALDKAKRGKSVKVDKEALAVLLRDHSRVVAALNGRVEE
jgi:hypothetical protein